MSTEYIKYKDILDYQTHSKSNNCTMQVCDMWIYGDKLWADTYQVDMDGEWYIFDADRDDWKPYEIDFLVGTHHIKRKTFIGHVVENEFYNEKY